MSLLVTRCFLLPLLMCGVGAHAETSELTWSQKLNNTSSSYVLNVGVATLRPLLNERTFDMLHCPGARKGAFYPAKSTAGCAAHVEKFFDEMRFDVDFTKKRDKDSVMFKSELAALGKDPLTKDYLKHIQDRLNGEEKFNLWTETMQFPGVGRNKQKAIRLLSVLFQDRDYYSQGTLPPEVESLKDAALAKLKSRLSARTVEGYPPGVKVNATGIYHFYNNAFIANQLAERGVPRRCAAALPFSFNEWYERDFRPDKRLDDTYTGYAGPAFALSDDKDQFTGTSFQSFQEAYRQGGREKVGDLYRSDFGGADKYCSEAGKPVSVPAQAPPARIEAIR